MQYFVEKLNGDRVSISKIQCDVLMREHGYRQRFATPSMIVVGKLRTARKTQDQRLSYGGGRLRNPYEHLTR